MVLCTNDSFLLIVGLLSGDCLLPKKLSRNYAQIRIYSPIYIYIYIYIYIRFTDIHHIYVCSGHRGLRNEGHSLDTWPHKMTIFLAEFYLCTTV